MNKGGFVKAIAEEAGSTIKDAQAFYDAAIAVLTKGLKKGEEFNLIGFGTFELKTRAARTGVNPQTGAPVKIPASKVPAFKPGKALKDSVK